MGDHARQAVEAGRAVIEARAAGSAAVYGVNTGFGSLSRHRVAPGEVRAIQRNLVRSHAAGVGEPLPDDVVRAAMLILAASLCRARSGVRTAVIERLIDLLNNDITPVVPSRGSVGASGDLAPLSHLALVLIGEGEAVVDGRVRSGGEALTAGGLPPLTLEAKEGLALVNGTHFMAAMGGLALADTERLGRAAVSAAAMAIDACRGTDAFLDERLHAARNQPGQVDVARALREQLAGSQIVPSHAEEDPRVQDPYSLRAAPQVLGAALDAVAVVRGVFERELGAVTDNPLVFTEDDRVVSGGNFHGMPLAIGLDLLAVALCHVAGIAERRVYWLLKASDGENPVNENLSPSPGLHSGLMIAQYTAAACCNELQTLAAPASVANIPTSAGMEDYNSMGVTAAHQARAAVDLATSVVAIELLVMCEALEYQRPLRSGAGVEATYERVRSVVPRLTEDRPPAPDIAAIADLIRAGVFGR
jgi:histidine ammonia-lyase